MGLRRVGMGSCGRIRALWLVKLQRNWLEGAEGVFLDARTPNLPERPQRNFRICLCLFEIPAHEREMRLAQLLFGREGVRDFLGGGGGAGRYSVLVGIEAVALILVDLG